MEDDIGKARVSVDGIEGTTNVVFTDASAPTQLGMYTLEGAPLVVDPVRQRLAPTHALRISRRTRSIDSKIPQHQALLS